MKQIFKSLKAHSSQSLALFIEIVIVTIAGWMVIEPVAVKTTMSIIPSGYDHNRLIHVKFASFATQSEEHDTTSTLENYTCYSRLLELIKERPGVESATYFTFQSFESNSLAMSSYDIDSAYNIPDEKWIGTILVEFVPGTDFFSTYGIKDANGQPFEEPEIYKNSFIVSSTLAKAKYADRSPIGQNLNTYDEEDKSRSTIVGISADASYRKGYGRKVIAYSPIDPQESWHQLDGLTIRLKDGENLRKFIDNFISDISDYRVGNIYLTNPVTFTDMQDENYAEKTRELSKAWMVLIFFLANVTLGVAGTFYVQCRSRASDSGVMRAFGATHHKIEWRIVSEACLTVILAWAIGSILYLSYLHFAHIEFENNTDKIIQILKPMWFDSAWSRNTIVGGIVLLLLLGTALLGAWLPARKIGRVNPVDALRDE